MICLSSFPPSLHQHMNSRYCMLFLFANMVNSVQPHLTCIYIAVCFRSECLLPDMCLYCAGLTMHATILAFVFSLVEEDKIGAPLYNAATIQASSNALYIQQYVADLIKQAYPHLQEWVWRCCTCFLCVIDSVSWAASSVGRPSVYMYLVLESHPGQFKNDIWMTRIMTPYMFRLKRAKVDSSMCVCIYGHGSEDQTFSTQPILLPLLATHPHPPRYNILHAMQHNNPLVSRSEWLLWLGNPAPPTWLFVLVVYAVLKWKYLWRDYFISTTISQLSRNICVTSSYRSRWVL